MSAAFQVAVAKSYDVRVGSKESLQESKIDRGCMTFMQRMENDSYNKRINNQLSEMRQDDMLKKKVDTIALNSVKADAEKRSGPKIVTHGPPKKADSESAWRPLDCL